MNKAIDRLSLVTDYEAVRALEHFADKFLINLDSSVDHLLRQAINFNQEIFGKEFLEGVASSETNEINENDSSRVSRKLLYSFAKMPETEELVFHSFEKWDDDYKKVGTTLAVGLVASLLLVIVSTEFEYNGELVHVHKKVLSAEQLTAIADVVKSYVGSKENSD